MLDPQILNALAPEVRQRFIQRLRHLEKLIAEAEFEAWQAKRRGPNLRQWREAYEKPPELSEWAKVLLNKSKTRQERMEEARRDLHLNQQCMALDERRMRRERRAKARAHAKKIAAELREEKKMKKMTSSAERECDNNRSTVEERRAEWKRLDEETRQRNLEERRQKDVEAFLRKAEETALKMAAESYAERKQRAAYLAQLNEKARLYFAERAGRAEPEPPVTIYNTIDGPSYKAAYVPDDSNWDAYWRLGHRLASTGRDELPSEWVQAHRDDSDETWWADASQTPK